MNKITVLVVDRTGPWQGFPAAERPDGTKWEFVIARSAEEAIEYFYTYSPSVVVIEAEMQAEALGLKKIIAFHTEEVPVLPMAGIGYASLLSTISDVMEEKNRKLHYAYRFVDDALKGAALPIRIE
ncbi:hypothetical protein KJS94_17885 [Flavihumibacter rivuli]|uniref:hypothetical protein n=1 Tax=Flavihumibacter rivuli TaxID=2838156 RepID=UPI001BDE1B6D|nr:hypothetical protein [Flavihumibacter rivuli]ULQ56525.1 hypothetical protein KJS94_17885 [Flavihumibacter rivuli]